MVSRATRLFADASSIEANTRIQIVAEHGGFTVVPLRKTAAAGGGHAVSVEFEPFGLPPLPAGEFERMSLLLRACWRRASASAAWLLYLNPVTRAWRCELPPQMLRVDGTVINAAECRPHGVLNSSDTRQPAAGQAEDERWLLAGSYATHPTCDPTMLALELPRVDGLRLFLRPGNWIDARAFVVAGGVAHSLPADEVVVEEAAVGEPEDVLNRLWIVTARDGNAALQ